MTSESNYNHATVDNFIKSGNGEAFRSAINDHSAMVNGFLNSGKGGLIRSFHQQVDSQQQHHTAGLTSDLSNYHYPTKVDNFLK